MCIRSATKNVKKICSSMRNVRNCVLGITCIPAYSSVHVICVPVSLRTYVLASLRFYLIIPFLYFA